MKKLDVKQNTEEWMEARKGRITGSKLKGFLSTSSYTKKDIKNKLDELDIEYEKGMYKADLEDLLPTRAKAQLVVRGDKNIGFYEYMAEKMMTLTGKEIDGEDPRDRGHRLETEAMELFCQKNDVEVIDDGFYVSDKDERLGYSPDGVFKNDETQEAEVKCLDAKYHLKYYLEGGVPDKFYPQAQHAFIVNPELKKLHFIMYCPQLPDIAYFSYEIKREDVRKDVEETEAILTELLDEADSIIKKIKEDNNDF